METEWEHAAKAGIKYIHAGSNNIEEVAWYYKNSGARTHPIAQKKPNAWGLYDMSGNVYEGVWDAWKSDAYSRGDCIYLITDRSSPKRVYRDGSWGNDVRGTRVSFRSGDDASHRGNDQGFRFLRTF